MKAKTQAELAEKFAQGEKEGQVSFLLISGDAIFNTEEDKWNSGGTYMPIAVRLTEKVALVNSNRKGSQWSDHKKKVIGALEHQGYATLDMYIQPLKSITDPLIIREVEKAEAIKILADNVEHCKNVLKDLGKGGDTEADYRIGQTQAQLALNERKQRALSQFISGTKETQGKATLDILVKLPEILEKAVKEQHIDDGEMQRILAARNEVRGIIEQVEKYLALIMMLPAPTPGAPTPAPTTGAGITVTGQNSSLND